MMNTEQPLVSCIMPTANRRRFVPFAIRQFQEQTYPNKELIVLDDGGDAVEDLMPDDPSIRYIRIKGSRTLGAKRNACVEVSRGEIIMHWDDDDWMAPWRIRVQVEALLRHDADICGTNRLYFYDPVAQQGWEYRYAGQKKWLAGGTFCYRKSLWERHRFLEINNGEDTRFIWSVPSGRIHAMPDTSFYVARVHSQNTSKKKTTTRQWHRVNSSKMRQLIQSFEGESRFEAFSDRVTVSIPYFKCRPYIRRAVESILAQSHTNLQLVVVNDGDPNPPWDLLQDITDERLVRFDMEQNQGRYFVDEVVLRATSDAYYVMQDADDWSEPGRIELLLEALQNEKAVAAVSSSKQWRQSGRLELVSQTRRNKGVRTGAGGRLVFYAEHCMIAKTSVLRALGGYYGGFRIGYDTFLMNLLLMAGSVVSVKEPLYNRLVRNGSLTTSPSTGMRSSKRLAVRRQLDHLYSCIYSAYQAHAAGSFGKEELFSRIHALVDASIPAADKAVLKRESDALRQCLLRSPLGTRREEGGGYQPAAVSPVGLQTQKSGTLDTLIDDIEGLGIPWGKWSISRATAEELIQYVNDARPRHMLELGSGISTLLFASYAKRYGATLVSLEHHPRYYRQTKRWLQRFGLDEFVNLHYVRLNPHEATYRWTHEGAYDFVFIDGPPERFGRGGTLPSVQGYLHKHAEVWLHDGFRKHETECVAAWREQYDFDAVRSDVGKGVWRLQSIATKTDPLSQGEPVLALR